MTEEPIFKSIFGEQWESLPPVMHRHYFNRPFSDDEGIVEGKMEIFLSPLIKVISPLLRLAGALVPYQGSEIPVTVRFISEPNSSAFCLDREFRLPGKKPFRFFSRMIPVGGNEVVEEMKFGIGWHFRCVYEEGKVKFHHKGYVWRICGRMIPVPLGLLLGNGYAEEEALSDDSFRMLMEITHRVFGKTYGYSGMFKVVK